MMDFKRLIIAIRILEKLHIEYMVTGSIAAIVYGKPRLTHDLDAVIEMKDPQVNAFVEAFEAANFYVPPLETIKQEIGRGDQGQFNLIDNESGFKIDIYPHKNDPLVTWAIGKRNKLELLPEEEAWVAPPEYVMVKKLLYFQEGGSEKHLEDIRGMLEVSGAEINQAEIERWVEQLKLEKSWAQVRQELR